MIPVTLTFSLAMLAGAPAGVFTVVSVADRTEVRLRNTAPPEDPAIDFENTPSTRLSLQLPHERLTIDYSPRVTLRDLNIATVYEVFHNGGIEASWRGPRTTLTFSERGGIGQNNFASLVFTTNPDGTPQVQSVPTQGGNPTTVRTGSTETTLIAVTSVNRRLRVTTRAAYLLAGGLDEASRPLLPVQSTISAGLGAAHALDRRNRFLVDTDASRTASSLDVRYVLLAGAVGVEHLFAPYVSGKLALGAAWVTSDAVSGTSSISSSTGYPTAEASLTATSGTLTDVRRLFASVRLAPLFNRVTGLVDPRLEGRLSGSWTDGPWTGAVAAGALESLPPDRPGGSELGQAEITMAIRLGENAQLDGGLRFISQTVQPTALSVLGSIGAPTTSSATTLSQELVFLGLLVHLDSTDL